MSLYPERVGDLRRPTVRLICDTCGATEDFTVGVRRGASDKPRTAMKPGERRKDLASRDMGQLNRKAVVAGWHVSGNKHVCPACSTRASEAEPAEPADMQALEPAVLKPAGLPEVLLPAMRREIRELLSCTYDTEKGCYVGDYSDASVAAELGARPEWVQEERELAYGASGENEQERFAREVLTPKLDVAVAQMDKQVEELLGQLRKNAETWIATLETELRGYAQNRMEQIKAELGATLLGQKEEAK